MNIKKYKLLAVHYILCYAEFTSQELYVLFVGGSAYEQQSIHCHSAKYSCEISVIKKVVKLGCKRPGTTGVSER